MAMVASDAYAMYYPHQVTLFFGCVYVVCELFLNVLYMYTLRVLYRFLFVRVAHAFD